jgi:hypothetical protein
VAIIVITMRHIFAQNQAQTRVGSARLHLRGDPSQFRPDDAQPGSYPQFPTGISLSHVLPGIASSRNTLICNGPFHRVSIASDECSRIHLLTPGTRVMNVVNTETP